MPFSEGERITIPSPIDVHVHLREPGGEAKETIESGTYAALRGGYQAVFDMPNNPRGMETWSRERLDEKIAIAKNSAQTNIGFYAGVNLEDPGIDEFPKMIGDAVGLKLYMGHTTGNAKDHDLEAARPAIDAWIRAASESYDAAALPPILLHARDGIGRETAEYVAGRRYPVHWCHLSTAAEALYAASLSRRHPDHFTAGVTPHHLTMTDRDAQFKYGWNGARMMPPLEREADGEALLAAFNKGDIQILETDHAPHTPAEKHLAETTYPEGHDEADCRTCYGISGIECVLPVMMSLVQRRLTSLERLVDATYHQPARMLGLAAIQGSQTVIEAGPYVIGEEDQHGKSRNHPYINWVAWGRVMDVRIGGVTRIKDGNDTGKDFQSLILRAGDTV